MVQVNWYIDHDSVPGPLLVDHGSFPKSTATPYPKYPYTRLDSLTCYPFVSVQSLSPSTVWTHSWGHFRYPVPRRTVSNPGVLWVVLRSVHPSVVITLPTYLPVIKSGFIQGPPFLYPVSNSEQLQECKRIILLNPGTLPWRWRFLTVLSTFIRNCNRQDIL